MSTDCSLRGDRVCDLSYRVNSAGVRTESGKGECIIEGCARNNCPKEAACIKVYSTDFYSVACDPLREDVSVDGQPPLDHCDPNEHCLPEGVCADLVSARTSCRLRCKKDRDCREGYRCAETGFEGIYWAPDTDDPTSLDQTRICIPDP